MVNVVPLLLFKESSITLINAKIILNNISPRATTVLYSFDLIKGPHSKVRTPQGRYFISSFTVQDFKFHKN